MKPCFFAALTCLLAAGCQAQVVAPAPAKDWPASTSVFEQLPPNPAAIVLGSAQFPISTDGQSDCAPAIQAALDTKKVVFLPSGTYRIGATLNLWKDGRLIGVGPTRPVLKLAANTPDWKPKQALIEFKPQQGLKGNDTFYSSLNNVDIEIEGGNFGAVGVNYHIAQGCSLNNVDFRLAPDTVGIYYTGNVITNCRFFGGKYGIEAPNNVSWQTLIENCLFDGQSEAGATGYESGLTFLNCQFRNGPVGISVTTGRTEQLVVQDSSFTSIKTAVEMDSLAKVKNSSHYLNAQNVRSEKVDYLLRVRGGETLSAKPVFGSATYGVHVGDDWSQPHQTEIRFREALSPKEPGKAASEWPEPVLPPVSKWKNVRDFGAVGNGKTDDTDAIKAAVAAHPVLYFPPGRYLISDTIVLRKDTALIALQPRGTRLVMKASTPGFGDAANPKAMLLAPQGGTNLVRGLGFSPELNPGAVAVRWLAGQNSILEDAFWEFYKTPRGTGQMHGLWISGGGTFRNLWLADVMSRSGLKISDTSTPGRVLLVSAEHHLERDVELVNVANWKLVALQTEGTVQSGIEMSDCRNLEFVNLFLYRTSASKDVDVTGAMMTNCSDIVFNGVKNFSLSPFPYRNTLFREPQGVALGQHAFVQATLK